MSHNALYKYISRLMAVLMALVLVIGAAPAARAEGESGTLGDNLSWSLSGGTLTITGKGAMADISETGRAPWHEVRNEIYQVVLPDGLTSVGDMAFYECSKLQSVVIPSSVTRIGKFAFAYCSDLKILNLGSGVTAIEECAFTDCYRLASLDLPGKLKTIGKKAFYRCESIPTVTIPSSVTSLGISAFGYCSSLVSADVQAKISEIPSLLFYGCDRLATVQLPDSVQTIGYHAFLDCTVLHTVYYNGKSQTPEQIQEAIGRDVSDFGSGGTVSSGTSGGAVTSGGVTAGADGSAVFESTTVNQGKNTTVSTQTQYTQSSGTQAGSVTTDITVTINGQNGWDEASDLVGEALNNTNGSLENTETDSTQSQITIYVKDTNDVDAEFIDNLAGQNVTITVVTEDGYTWQFKGTDLETTDKSARNKKYDLRYEVTPGTAELCEELGTQQCFVVKFLESTQINAEVMIRLDSSLSMQNATFFQRDKELTRIQSSVVDHDGYAHFYLASVSDRTEYYIAMNLPEAHQDAIVPEALYEDYGKPEYVEPIKYEITGRKSSWGMNLGQVTWIMVGVLLTVVIAVGFTMYFLNRRKLKMGYVPDLDEEYDM